MSRRNQLGRLFLRKTGSFLFAATLVAAGYAVLCPFVARAAQGDCAQPVSTGDGPIVSDCLSILRTAVGGPACDPACACAPKGSLPTSALDALICLKAAVGQSVTLDCPCGTASTTITTVTTTSTSPSTTATLPEIYTASVPSACLTFALRRAFAAPVTMHSSGQVELLIDRSSLGDRDGNGFEDALVTVYFFHFETSSDVYGDVTLDVIDSAIHPGVDQTSIGVIEEAKNDTPGELDLPPFAPSNAGALLTVNLVLQAVMNGPNAVGRGHNDFPLILQGLISAAAPPPGQLLGSQNSTDVPLLSDNDHSFFNIWIDTAPPVLLELNPQSCE